MARNVNGTRADVLGPGIVGIACSARHLHLNISAHILQEARLAWCPNNVWAEGTMLFTSPSKHPLPT